MPPENSIRDGEESPRPDSAVPTADLGVLLASYGNCCADCEPPPTGTFTLHGRPVDTLADGKVLIYIRARFYDPQHGRWLQRDPSGYVDGGNLYESFLSNPTAHTDPSGEEVWVDAREAASTDSKGRPIWVVTYTRHRTGVDLPFASAATQLFSGNWWNPEFRESESLVQIYPRVRQVNIWNVIRHEQDRLADEFVAAADEQAYETAIITAASAPIAIATAGASQAVATGALSRIGLTQATGLGRVAISATSGGITGGVSFGGGTAAVVPLGVSDVGDILPNTAFGAVTGAVAGAGLSSTGSLLGVGGRSVASESARYASAQARASATMGERIESVAQRAFNYAVDNPRVPGLSRMQLGKDAEIQASRWLRRWAEHNDVPLGPGGLQFQVRGANSVPDVVFDPTRQIFDFKLSPAALRPVQTRNFMQDFPEFTLVMNLGIMTVAFARRPRARLGRCRACGYDLRGTLSRRCPECGNILS